MPTATKPITQIIFRVDETLTAPIANRTRSGEGAPGANHTARRDLERYYALLERERRSLAGTFTLNELLALADAANGTMFEAFMMHYYAVEVRDYCEDGCAVKWGIDGDSLVHRIESLSPGAVWALIDGLERWWVASGGQDAESFMGVGVVPAEGN